ELFTKAIGLFTASPASAHAAEDYLSIRILGAPFVLLYVALREVRYARGDSQTPMRATLLANVVNIGLAVLFVFGFSWGWKGAAAATIIAHAIEAGTLVWSQRELGGFHLAGAKAEHARTFFRVGVPTGLQF